MKSFLASFSGLGPFAVLIAAGVAVGNVALAEDAPARIESGHAAVAPAKKAPEFVPIVVDRAQYEAVMGHLNGMAFKDALPLVRWLNELEERARKQWEADNAPKTANPPK